MRNRTLKLYPIALVVLCLLTGLTKSMAAETGEHGVVATINAMASEAGVRAMKAGGNAVDAAVAAGLTLGVVDGFNSGIGGGCFMLIRLPNGKLVALDGRETAPKAATKTLFQRDGKAVAELSLTGPLAVATPGALAAYAEACKRFGKLPLSRHLRDAAELAEKGFAVDKLYASRAASAATDLRKFPGAAAIFLRSDLSPLQDGDTLKQPDLARTYRKIASEGVGWFYKSAFAKTVGEWMKTNGGVLSAKDFASYVVKEREPIVTTYRGHTIAGFPPPSSGGVHVAQILNILESFDLAAMGPNSADFVHVVTEAMKAAFADRAHWLGDPDFAPVPRGLLSKEYAKGLAKRIQMARASEVASHGTPPEATSDLFGKHTTHFSTADREGYWVACTGTINTTYGSKVVVPGTGVVLNNEMDDFSAQAGVPNSFGLVGAEANAVEPGKRPLSSMSPTIVLIDGKPVFSVGAAGGPTIISQVVLAIVDHLDFKMDAKSALGAYRFHHQWRPDELRIEERVGAEVVRELEKRSHKVVVVKSMAASQAVEWVGGVFTGVSEPRSRGRAAGW